MSWDEIKAEWSAGWTALEAQAIATYEVAITADPEQYRAHLIEVLGMLEASRASLDRMKAELKAEIQAGRPMPGGALKTLKGLEQRYNDLAAGVYGGATGAQQVGSVGLIIGGVLFAVAAIAFGLAAYQYCANLRDQTALAEKELDERVKAARDGVVIPAAPLTTPPAAPELPGANGASAGLVVGGLATLAVAGGAAWWFLRR